MNPESSYQTLTRHFLSQFFENELVAPQGELRSGVTGMLAFVAVPGALLSFLCIDKYSTLLAFFRALRGVDRDVATWHEKIIFLTLAIVIPALALLLKWDSLFPSRRDHAILVHLPIERSTILYSKATALFLFVLLFAVSVNLAATLLFPLIVLGDTGTFLQVIRYIAAHAAATMAASLSMCFTLVAAQGAALSLLGFDRFRRVSAWLQFLLITALLALMLLTPTLSALVRKIRPTDTALLLPPFWFLGLYEALIGKTDPVSLQLAERAIQVLLLSAFAAILTYGLSYGRHFRRIPESLERGSAFARPIWSWLETVARKFVPEPPRLAVFLFICQTFTRSQLHKLLFGVFVALAAALLVSDAFSLLLAGGSPGFAMLAAPLTITFFLITGFRFLYEIPVELPAHWVFRIAWAGTPVTFHRTIWVPLAAVLAMINFSFFPRELAVLHTLYCLLLSALLSEAVFLGYRKIPFTCSFGAGKWNVTYVLSLWFLAFVMFTWLTVRIEAMLFPFRVYFVFALLAGGVLLFWLSRRRRELWEENPQFQFYDGQSPAVQTLDLAQ